jgi:hypothetical protein
MPRAQAGLDFRGTKPGPERFRADLLLVVTRPRLYASGAFFICAISLGNFVMFAARSGRCTASARTQGRDLTACEVGR